MTPALLAPEGELKCKCEVEPVIPPDGMCGPPAMGIGQVRCVWRSPPGFDIAPRVP